MTKRRVLIIDDSAYNRTTLSRIVGADPELEVIATAADGEEALRKTLQLEPDLITLDLDMPRMDGFTFLRIVMQKRPVPIVVVSAQAQAENVFKALELGAVDFLAKPTRAISERLHEIAPELLGKLRAASRIRPRVPVPPQRPAMRADDTARGGPVEQLEGIVVIGASTGGPSAIQRLLGELPILPVSILIAQHMPPRFTEAFAARLNRYTAYGVEEATGGESLRSGTCWIGPGGKNLTVHRHDDEWRLQVSAPSGDRYVPSVDRLLQSAATAAADRVLSVVLTGMGDDGAAGSLEIRKNGGMVFVESEETAVVFGMPREAARIAGAHRMLPLPELPKAIAQWVEKVSMADRTI